MKTVLKTFRQPTIRHHSNTEAKLEALDQTALPQKEIWIDVSRPADLISAIQKLQIRGAPLIGVAAALGFAKLAESGASVGELTEWGAKIRAARPTAVNLMNAMDRVLKVVSEGVAAIVNHAESILDEDIALCERMAVNGASLIENGDVILTHCNAGALATAGCGTAVGSVIRAHEQGKKIHVYVDETRPLLQGGRLTTWELKRAGVPHTLICDNMAAVAMRDRKINKIFVGADRIATNGDFANKIGTYSLAVLAKYHGVQMITVAPETTLDRNCKSGSEIHIEERGAAEIQNISGAFESPVWNPAFDVTPVELVSFIVTDKGVFSREDIKRGAL